MRRFRSSYRYACRSSCRFHASTERFPFHYNCSLPYTAITCDMHRLPKNDDDDRTMTDTFSVRSSYFSIFSRIPAQLRFATPLLFFYRPTVPSAAAANTCSSNRGRGRPTRIIMPSSQLPTARPSDIPAVTPTQPVSAVARGEGLSCETLPGSIDSHDRQGAPFTEIVYKERRLQRGRKGSASVSNTDTIIPS